MKKFSWTILIIRCDDCKGLIEIPINTTVLEALKNHIKNSHGLENIEFKEFTIDDNIIIFKRK